MLVGTNRIGMEGSMTEEHPIRVVHQIVIGLGGEGFRAICSCGWRSVASWSRDVVASARDDHRRRSRLGSAP